MGDQDAMHSYGFGAEVKVCTEVACEEESISIGLARFESAGFSGSGRKASEDGGVSMNNLANCRSFGSPGTEGCPASGPPAFRMRTKKSAYVTRCPSASSAG